jgi:hypothetical protein
MISEGFVLCPTCGPGLSSGKTKTTVLVLCRKGQKCGFCDRDRKMLVQAAYDGARPFAKVSRWLKSTADMTTSM